MPGIETVNGCELRECRGERGNRSRKGGFWREVRGFVFQVVVEVKDVEGAVGLRSRNGEGGGTMVRKVRLLRQPSNFNGRLESILSQL